MFVYPSGKFLMIFVFSNVQIVRERNENFNQTDSRPEVSCNRHCRPKSKMTRFCKGVCQRYKGRRRYFNPANKKCSTCDVFMDREKWDGDYCPCCSQRLSTKANQSNNHQKLLIKRKVKRIG